MVMPNQEYSASYPLYYRNRVDKKLVYSEHWSRLTKITQQHIRSATVIE